MGFAALACLMLDCCTDDATAGESVPAARVLREPAFAPQRAVLF